METVILRSKNKKYLAILKAMVKALKFEVEFGESPYDPAFVAKIRQSEQDIKEGINQDDIGRGEVILQLTLSPKRLFRLSAAGRPQMRAGLFNYAATQIGK